MVVHWNRWRSSRAEGETLLWCEATSTSLRVWCWDGDRMRAWSGWPQPGTPWRGNRRSVSNPWDYQTRDELKKMKWNCLPHYDNVLQEADGVLIVNVQHAPLQQADDGKNQTLKLPAGCEVAIKHVEESEASLFFLVKENMIEIEIHVYYENTQNDKRGE